MTARDDFMAVRRAAQYVESGKAHAHGDEVAAAQAALLRKASAREMGFIELYKRTFYAEVIDLAYAIMGERRPGGLAAETEADRDA